MDFGEKYDQGVYFHISGGSMADDYGKRDAFAILVNAAKKAYGEEIRPDEVQDAINYLKGFSTRDRPFEDYLKALGIPDPTRRVQSLYDALHRIKKGVS